MKNLGALRPLYDPLTETFHYSDGTIKTFEQMEIAVGKTWNELGKQAEYRKKHRISNFIH